MGSGRMIRGLVACCLLAAAAGAKDQASACMSGVRCGNMCAPLGGACINNQCYDSLGYLSMCYAPLATAFAAPQGLSSGPSWWQPSSFFPLSFAPFRPFQPFMAPMQPMQPFEFTNNILDCGGNGPCQVGAFCDPSGACREDTCENQFQFGCPKDEGSLQKVNCIHNSGFNRCYESSTGGFKCYKGPAGGSISCASNGYSSTSATMTSNFDTGAPDDSAATATGSATSSSGSSSSSTGPAAAGAGSYANSGEGSNSAVAGSTGDKQVRSPDAASAAAAAKGASSDNGAAAGNAAAAAGVSTAAVNGQKQQQSKRLKRKGAAAAAATEVPSNKATKTFIKNGASSNQQVTVSPDGKTVTVIRSANDGSGGAVGSASGDQQFVATNVIPGGSSVISSSSSGNNGQPAAASASAGSSSGAQPLYTPNAAEMLPMGPPGYNSYNGGYNYYSTGTQGQPMMAAAAAGGGNLRGGPSSSAGLGCWVGLGLKGILTAGFVVLVLS